MKRLMIVFLLIPVLAIGEPRPHLKKDNPNELGWLASAASECPMTDDEVAEVLKGVLIRSRIKPVPLTDGLGIYVDVVCYGVNSSTQYAFSIDVDFVDKLQVEGWLVPIRYMYGDGYDAIGIQNKEALMQATKDSVERAITDYLKANFDLGEDDQ